MNDCNFDVDEFFSEHDTYLEGNSNFSITSSNPEHEKKNVNDPLENQFFSSACYDNFDENTITENGLNLATIKDSGVPIHEDECPEHLRDLEMVELGNIPILIMLDMN